MNKLSKILLTGAIAATSLLPINTNADLKKEAGNAAKIVAYNAIRKERDIETFSVPNKLDNYEVHKTNFKDNYGNLKDRDTKVLYNLQSPSKNNYTLSVIAKDHNKHDWKGTGKERYTIKNKHSRINESSKLLIFHHQDTKIKNIHQQGYFVKQNFWKASKTTGKTKGMIKFSEHEDAQALIKTGEAMLSEVGDKIENYIPFFKKGCNKFISLSKEKARIDINELKDKFGKNLKVTIVPTYIPDKLSGQTMTRVDYNISISSPKDSKIYFYNITNLGNPSDVDNTSGQMPEGFAQTRCSLEGKVEKGSIVSQSGKFNVRNRRIVLFIDLETNKSEYVDKELTRKEKSNFLKKIKNYDICIEDGPGWIWKLPQNMQINTNPPKITKFPFTVRTKEGNLYRIRKEGWFLHYEKIAGSLEREVSKTIRVSKSGKFDIQNPITAYFIDLETDTIERVPRRLSNKEARKKIKKFAQVYDLIVTNQGRQEIMKVPKEIKPRSKPNRIRKNPFTMKTKEGNTYQIRTEGKFLHYKKLN